MKPRIGDIVELKDKPGIKGTVVDIATYSPAVWVHWDGEPELTKSIHWIEVLIKVK